MRAEMAGQTDKSQWTNYPQIQRLDVAEPVNHGVHRTLFRRTGFLNRAAAIATMSAVSFTAIEVVEVATSAPAAADVCSRNAKIAQEKGIFHCPVGTPRVSSTGEPLGGSVSSGDTQQTPAATETRATPQSSASSNNVGKGRRDYSVTVCGTPTRDMTGDGRITISDQKLTQRAETGQYNPTAAQCANPVDNPPSSVVGIVETIVNVHAPNIADALAEAGRKARDLLVTRNAGSGSTQTSSTG